MVYSVSEENENCFVPDTQDVTVGPNSQEVMLDESISDGEPVSQGLCQSFDTLNIWNEISNFKKFQMDVERKLCVLEDAVISGKEIASNSLKDDNTSIFVVDILKDRISFFESEVKSKDVVIEYLTKQLSSVNLNRSQKKNSDNNLDDTLDDESLNKTNNDKSSDKSFNDGDQNTVGDKKSVIITGDSMLNGVHERGLSKNHRVKINNFPGGTSKVIFDNIHDIMKSKPDYLIVHAGTNGLTNGTNLLNQAKKIVKEVQKISNKTKIVFSSIIVRKDVKNISKKVSEVNSHLKNYCAQKNIDYIDNSNIKEDHLGAKKLHLSKKGNSILANNFLKYLRSDF